MTTRKRNSPARKSGRRSSQRTRNSRRSSTPVEKDSGGGSKRSGCRASRSATRICSTDEARCATRTSATRQPCSRQRKRSAPEIELAALLQAHGVDEPELEYQFHPTRKWRFDFAWPAVRLAVEVEGGVYGRGRHVRPSGFIKDCEKYNAAALAGWVVLRFVPRAGWLDEALREIKHAIYRST